MSSVFFLAPLMQLNKVDCFVWLLCFSYGYPDYTYLTRVRQELAAKGITSENSLARHEPSVTASHDDTSAAQLKFGAGAVQRSPHYNHYNELQLPGCDMRGLDRPTNGRTGYSTSVSRPATSSSVTHVTSGTRVYDSASLQSRSSAGLSHTYTATNRSSYTDSSRTSSRQHYSYAAEPNKRR